MTETRMSGITTTAADAEREGDDDGVPPGAEFVVDADGELEGEGKLEEDSDGYFELEAVFEADAPSVKSAVPLLELVREPLRVGVFDGEFVCEDVGVGVIDPDAPFERELVGDGDVVPDKLIV